MFSKTVKKKLITLSLLMMVMFVFCSSVLASSYSFSLNESADIEMFNDLIKDEELKLKQGADGTGNAGGVLFKQGKTKNTYSFDVENFLAMSSKDQNKILGDFVIKLKDSNISDESQQYIYNSMQESDSTISAMLIPLIFKETRANLYSALKIIYPFLAILRVVFGIGAIILALLLVMSTIMDLMYIGLPVARQFLSTKAEANGGASAENRPFGISVDAIITIKEVEGNLEPGKYKNPYGLYLKKRITTYILLGICLLYLVLGEIGGLMSALLNLVSGFIG